MHGSLIAGMALVPGRVIDISEASSTSLYCNHIQLSLSWLQSGRILNASHILLGRKSQHFSQAEKRKKQLDKKKVSRLEPFKKKWILHKITLAQYGLTHHTVSSINTDMIQNALSC